MRQLRNLHWQSGRQSQHLQQQVLTDLLSLNAEAQALAERVLKRVFQMFDAWIGGYIAIILLESVLYCVVFLLFQVPYAIPLGLIAGMTILLPFLGPVASFILTLVVTLIFSPTVTLPLIGICLAYLLINGLLDQFFLYPTLVGEAIGLTTLETIISVLAGAAIAGISGMIFAVPASALLKLLIPLVYRAYLRRKAELPEQNRS